MKKTPTAATFNVLAAAAALTHLYWWRTAVGSSLPARVSPEYDLGIRRKPSIPGIMRLLEAARVVERVEGVARAAVGRTESTWGIAPSLVEATVAERPDIATLADVAGARDAYALTHLHGALLDKLTAGNLRWIAEHADECRFYNRYGHVTPRGTGSCERVTDGAFDAAVAARIEAMDLDRVTRTNLAWGLKTAGLITPEQAEAIRTEERAGRLFEDSTSNLGDDPDKWGEHVVKAQADLRERIAASQARLATLEHVAAAVEKAGGWDAFVADYRERIAVALREQRAAKAEETKTEETAATATAEAT